MNIDDINRLFFGVVGDGEKKDYTRDYLLQDFEQAVKTVITHDIIFHATENGSGDVLFLSEMAQVYDLGLFITLRKLLNDEKKNKKVKNDEPGSFTGINFVKAVDSLNDNTLCDYLKSDEILDPFNKKWITKKEMIQEIRELKKMAGMFRSYGYENKIISENEAIGLHKDRDPIKRKVAKKDIICIGSIPIKSRTYVSKFYVDTILIAKCLERFAELLLKYKRIMEYKDAFPVRLQDCSINEYIDKGLKSLGYVGNKGDEEEIVASIVKHFEKSLKILRWRVD